MVLVVVAGGVSVVPAQYALTVNNNSGQRQDVCIYQKPVDLGVPNAMT